MTQTALWLTEPDVASQVTLQDTIVALEAGLGAVGAGQGFNIPKALAGFGDASSLHSLGSVLTGAGYCGFKNWINTKRGAKAMFVLFDANQGRLLAMMEANALGQLRTAAMTGLGTKWLARQDVSDLAIVGSGRQALTQIAAINAVRPLARIRVWSPTAEKRSAFAARVRAEFDAEVVDAATLEACLDGAPLVTLVTRAASPFLHAALLARGAHLNAVGAILPANAEFFADVFERVGFIAVDDVPNTQKASREFIDYFGPADSARWARVRPLGEVIASGKSGQTDGDLSLFKAMGMGISDLAVAIMAYERASAAGLGQAFPLSEGVPLRWKAPALA